ncbi:TIGR03016 family PEP-CTERM system-associated outer membrane protein [Paraglaciecola psychrophila]|uniref:TIGR03016 family PEP-CTERM system-associated outer membrane protein n=1 Tax=Paraglaciecola psychrophila TaxID=326544 RepID=UPI00029128C3|nr:TIGR03016 family PEP-CTERM system-associated outer membrane protein [Paraglaciecola psychrophila]GAC40323.1 hypothetical protein GPSY_4721 [Paraglaciecola psychrophila 170]
MVFWPLLKQKQTAKKPQQVKYAAILLMSLSFSAFGQAVDISGKLNTTSYVTETQIGDNEASQTEALIIKPSLLGSYNSRLLSASLTTNHSRVRRSVDSENVNNKTNQNYTDLKYTSNLTLIENALSLTLSGAQNYRVINQQQNGFSDVILGSDNLTKNRNNSAQLNFSIPNPLYVGFTLQSTYSKTQTDQSQAGQTGVDGENLGITARLFQGKYIRPLNFDISAQYNDTSRANFQNFESTRVQANTGFPITKEVGFIVTGSLDEYDTGQTEFSSRQNLDTTSYGAGLEWTPSNGRNLSLTYNQLEEGETTTDFLGVNLAWAFSNRTALNFDYGKRFFGDSYKLDFRHSLKSLRTSVSYSEDLTTFSRLGTSSTNVTGIFVCQFGSTDLIDCFQPDSVDYQLQVGEEFRTTTEVVTDISEEVILRKSGTASIGYSKRKVTMSIDASYRRTEYLESDRLSINRSLRLNVNYAIGRKTNISFASTLATNQFNELETADTTTTTSINFSRDLGRYLKLSIAARFLDRESDNLERNGTDERLTVGLNYTF